LSRIQTDEDEDMSGPDLTELCISKNIQTVSTCDGSSLSRIIELGISTPFDCSWCRSNHLIAVAEEAQGCWMLTLLAVLAPALTLGHA